MPRIARIVVPGIAHHITQRGNRRQNVFLSDSDRRYYLELVMEYSLRAGLAILAYCLMTNHIHLIAIPAMAVTLEKVFRPLDMRYTQHFNNRVRSCGRLWQGRFQSCPMDEDHMWAAIRYVERNPVRAEMVARAEDYQWSSASHRCGLLVDPVLSALPHPFPPGAEDWSKWLAYPEDDFTIDKIRLHTRTGRPYANEAFSADLERLLGRTLRALPIGRPRKTSSLAPEKVLLA
jgi:putative transposase